ncbi:CHRD domain-containing protein [Ramlibacter sp.]|uniref:CHRD domain-containing protein n=1 Tax=Ramlibacter sp. TaxID=1917967 RepID=UPI00182AB6EC|nr:CHRD domain-containing protein [Ramlibacter sp.]MBA2673990.1 CHRD domain-containing protein [Ramlibacter sp.]
MIDRATFFRTLAATVLLGTGLGLAGCGQFGGTSPRSEFYDAKLEGAQEVPPAATAGSGQVELQFNEKTSIARWKIAHAGLSGPVTAGHIHGPAGPGQNAGVQVPFAGNLNAVPLQGEAKLSPQQANELMSGLWYVNLHTAKYPNGEVRGQLRVRH